MAAPADRTPAPAVPHVDTLVVGAGLSGIGMACQLGRTLPGHSYLVLEGREASGGTWDLFRYPGVRSDSDLHTLGYAFKPWTKDRAIADGADILGYIREAARENGVDPHIRYGHRVVRAEWSSEDVRWTVHAVRTDTGEPVRFTSRFLFSATGYYRYDEGHTPPFPGTDRYRGALVHPQHWPRELDHTHKRVVVIGSGATAVTLVPALARRAAHVTLLQRSPTYVLPLPSRDPVADVLRRTLGERAGYALTRRKNVALQTFLYRTSRRHPAFVRTAIRLLQRRMLPRGFALDPHFRPSSDPWDQRLCVVPDGDLFRALSSGRASVVTDQVDTFTPYGVALRSGGRIDADVVVTATGLDLLAFGGIELAVDGREIDVTKATAYKGMLLSGVPNFAFALGYTTISWTLRVGLVGEHYRRLLAHMAARGHTAFEVDPPAAGEPDRPLFDFAAGYARRAAGLFPRQGTSRPWRMNVAYRDDERLLRHDPVADAPLRFTSRPAARPAPDGTARQPGGAVRRTGRGTRGGAAVPPGA
ncbi:flavin-containing monooxygenase [Streptomyces sp. NPDC058417]|uniref:flavin-containing monooxygenase n=1 Tax=unclassified Streptomyces TaxID=2593676 RepID=UPI0036461A0D